MDDLLALKVIKYNDSQPCNHKGCISHRSHPCEGCGRKQARGIITESPLKPYEDDK